MKEAYPNLFAVLEADRGKVGAERFFERLRHGLLEHTDLASLIAPIDKFVYPDRDGCRAIEDEVKRITQTCPPFVRGNSTEEDEAP